MLSAHGGSSRSPTSTASSEEAGAHFDFTHLTLTVGYSIMTEILIGPSRPHEPLVRPLAMPVLIILIQLGLQMVISGIMNLTNCAAPFRISSIPKGGRLYPMLYTIVEDIIAVDGGAGKAYRGRLRARYDASWRFRLLIAQLNWFWAIGALLRWYWHHGCSMDSAVPGSCIWCWSVRPFLMLHISSG